MTDLGQAGLGFDTAAGLMLSRVQSAEGRRLAGAAEARRIGIEGEQDRDGALGLAPEWSRAGAACRAG